MTIYNDKILRIHAYISHLHPSVHSHLHPFGSYRNKHFLIVHKTRHQCPQRSSPDIHGQLSSVSVRYGKLNREIGSQDLRAHVHGDRIHTCNSTKYYVNKIQKQIDTVNFISNTLPGDDFLS